jgi:hypothetical protein
MEENKKIDDVTHSSSDWNDFWNSESNREEIKMNKKRKLGFYIGIVAASLAILLTQAWCMTVILGWFAVQINMWQALGMIILIKSITSRSSDK